MTQLVHSIVAMFTLVACGGTQPPGSPGAGADDTGAGADDTTDDTNEFKLNLSDTAASAHGVHPSKIKPTRNEAAVKFIVVDKDEGPVKGVVISLTSPSGKKYYTEETDAEGYAEVLVPVGQKYDLIYLSLGRRDISAKVPVPDEPNQNIKLTLRYKRHVPPSPPKAKPDAVVAPRYVLEGIYFDTGKTTIRDDSFEKLDDIVEFMAHKKSARIEISGHTDNVGDPKNNRKLSEKRAQACRDYLISKGIDKIRISAVGYGDERPIAPNDTEEGRQKNRRIEAMEL